METLLYILIALAIVVLLGYALRSRLKTRPALLHPLTAEKKMLLQEHVPFYSSLAADQRLSFEKRVQYFLSTVTITGVNTTVTELDKVLIGASAIIPIFGFPGWEYINLNEVLVYPDSFGEEFEQEGQHRHTLGMVGTGALNHVMILSQHELRQSFVNRSAKTNVAIHEFIHLLDKTDGSIDGIPETLMDKQYVVPWLKLIQQNIKRIIDNKSDINSYGATSEAEFFAVASEYFFERPDLLQSKHPELYELLSQVFRQQPKTV